MNWIRYSGLWITLIVNPLHWQVNYVKNSMDKEWPSPSRSEHVVQILMFSFRLVIDRGDW